MCCAIGVIGEGVLTNRIRLCILDMSVSGTTHVHQHLHIRILTFEQTKRDFLM